MHAFITVLAAQQAAANAAAVANFDPHGQFTFSVPLYAATAPDDSTPLRYCCAPEFQTAADLAKAQALQASFSGSTFTTYDLTDANPAPTELAALGLRFGKPL